MTKVMRKEARHTQRRDRASGVPLEILEHLPPKPESAYFLLCAFTYPADFIFLGSKITADGCWEPAYCILHIECSTFHSIIFQDLE